MRKGADVKARDEAGITPLYCAVAWKRSSPAQIQALIDAGADVNSQGPPHGATILMHAAAQCEPDAVRALIKAGAKLDARAGGDRTPLMYAAANGCAATVKILLEAGSDAELRDEKGRTARTLAKENHPDITAAFGDEAIDTERYERLIRELEAQGLSIVLQQSSRSRNEVIAFVSDAKLGKLPPAGHRRPVAEMLEEFAAEADRVGGLWRAKSFKIGVLYEAHALLARDLLAGLDDPRADFAALRVRIAYDDCRDVRDEPAPGKPPCSEELLEIRHVKPDQSLRKE